MLKAIDREDLAEDPRFALNRDRMANRETLAATLAPSFRERSSGAWLARLEAGGVPAGPVLDVKAMHEDPQTLAR
ncbi:CoA transferase, partial [Lacticaseibacillus rhamnosus]|uniref:CoA transferase n=1 Tax=Lacticaseibacillus rhamnosus TaxID=47715 RepID=UPI003F4854A8